MRKLQKEELDYILSRVKEIIRCYAYDRDESYVWIELYFEKGNGENQHKRFTCGSPSHETPDRFRDEPAGYKDGLEGYDRIENITEMLNPSIVWKNCNGREWDSTPLIEIRRRQDGKEG